MMYQAGDSSRRERKGGEPPFFDGGSSEGAEGGPPSLGYNPRNGRISEAFLQWSRIHAKLKEFCKVKNKVN